MNKAISSWGNEVNDSDRYIIRDTDINNEIVATFNDMSDVQHFIDTITSINTGEIGIEVVDTKNNEVIMSKSMSLKKYNRGYEVGDKVIMNTPGNETYHNRIGTVVYIADDEPKDEFQTVHIKFDDGIKPFDENLFDARQAVRYDASTRKMHKQRIIKGTEALLFCTDDPEMYLMTHDGYPEYMLNTPFGTISEQMVEPDYDYYRPGNVSYYYKYSWDGNIQEIDIAEARTMYDRIMEYRREREQDEWSTRKMRKSLNWVDATNVRGQPYSTSDTEGYDYLYGIDFQDGQYRTAITDNVNHVEYEVKYFPTMDEAKAYLEGIYNSGRYKMTDGITAEGCRKASPILAKSFKEQYEHIKSKKRW